VLTTVVGDPAEFTRTMKNLLPLYSPALIFMNFLQKISTFAPIFYTQSTYQNRAVAIEN
jgi:hypothetical protein